MWKYLHKLANLVAKITETFVNFFKFCYNFLQRFANIFRNDVRPIQCILTFLGNYKVKIYPFFYFLKKKKIVNIFMK